MCANLGERKERKAATPPQKSSSRRFPHTGSFPYEEAEALPGESVRLQRIPFSFKRRFTFS
ncbi:hypothetical protein D7Z54_31385 [Salibacterium salarium]|uniref:Uncharacterized protein n=1 Tax=Salibacterium salarium TaxID=284579 RepID=A0A3R9QFP9_9BACI|nr:hypothetical protein D7Z54_31385 [Salibacterium salarium]